jgi:hypothetical protein
MQYRLENSQGLQCQQRVLMQAADREEVGQTFKNRRVELAEVNPYG